MARRVELGASAQRTQANLPSRDAMTLTVQILEQLIASLPASEDTWAALNFLKQSDLIRDVPTSGQSDYSPAEDWLRIYRIRHKTTMEGGIVTYGFPSLLAALEALPPSEPVAMTGFQTKEWFGFFWSDQADRLAGFVLVKRRSPQEEQERLDWFRRNLTQPSCFRPG
jgi:hypothetical protein